MSEPALSRANVTFLPGSHVADGLLVTKLLVPPTRPALVARPRLFARLDEALAARVAVVSAAAGSGKTTLLSAWIAARPYPAAWVSLDEGDSDPVRFWRYVLAAIDGVAPGAPSAALSLLRALQTPDAVLTALINALAALPEDVVLVLDDYHLITSQPIHDQLAHLLDRLPPRLHVILASRADPPLPLARLRVRGQLVELGVGDLRFTPDEAGAFLRDVMGLEPTTHQIAALESSTEGWIAGLQLAALSMRGRDDMDTFLAAFAGGHRHVVDYLAGEVIERQPDEVRAFLLRTSIFDRLTAPLCDAATGLRGGQAMLRRLLQGNLFLIPLDDAGHWYRYHHLFADALRTRLREDHPELVPMLHRRAYAWLESNELLEEAVPHALAAGDTEHAAGLVVRATAALWNRSEIGQIRGWLATLPDDVIRARPRLGMYRAWATFITGTFRIDPRLLAEVENSLRPDTPTDERLAVTGALLMMRAFLARLEGDHRRGEVLARQSLAVLPAGELTTRGMASICLGHGVYARGDLDEAYIAYSEAARTAELAGDAFTLMGATLSMANVAEERADLRAAYALYLRTGERIARSDLALPAAGYLETGLAGLLIEWDRPDEAEPHARRAWDLAKTSQISDFQLNAPILLAYIHHLRGDRAQADAALGEVERMVEGTGVPWLASIPRTVRARLELAWGDLAAAERWAAAAESSPLLKDAEYTLDSPARSVRTTLARVRLAQCRPSDAVALLEPLRSRAERTGFKHALIESSMLLALAARARGDTPLALDLIERALALAEPSGYIRLFVNEGKPLAALLAELRARRVKALAPPVLAYVETLLAHFPSSAATAQFPAASSRHLQGLPEPLSEREREVLALVVAGASNAEIAASMVVSIHTVKTHLTHIFAKLGVASRTQAIARARDLGLA